MDSSAIALTLRSLKDKAVEALSDGMTLDLARYELGNIIWKECTLQRTISPEEAIEKADGIAKILELMKILQIESNEDLRETMRLATDIEVTFYDASYLHKARNNDLNLITGDKRLENKAKQAGVKIRLLSEFLMGFA